MGLKKFKEFYNVYHTVHFEGDNLLISSDFIQGLIQISRSTGEIQEGSRKDILATLYPKLRDATRSEILALLAEPDQYTASVPVFIVKGEDILELQCERLAAQQVTHCGMVIRGHFSGSRDVACQKLIKRLELRREQDQAYLETIQEDLLRAQARLNESITNLETAKMKYGGSDD